LKFLSAELAGRSHIAGEEYTIADIVAQCACVLGKFTGLRIPPEMAHLTRWFAAVSARPKARA
jgi:glutathione S-transferase